MAAATHKILVLDTGKEWGGGTNSLLELIKRLDRSRFTLHALFYHNYRQGQGDTIQQVLQQWQVPCTILPPQPQPLWAKLGKEISRGLLTPFKTQRQQAVAAIENRWRIQPRAQQIAAQLRQGDFAALYMNNQPESNLEGYLAADLAGCAVIQHCRTRPTLSAAAIAAANHADAVIAVSPSVATHLQQSGVHNTAMHVVMNGIDVQQIPPAYQTARTELGLPRDLPLTVTVASLLPRKGVAELIQALALVPDMALAVVGDGPQKSELQLLAKRSGVAERVLWVGFSATPLQWMAAADIVALASASEGLPRVLLEAMLCARPVLASAVSGSRDVVVDGETGLLFPYQDTAALAQAWQRLADDYRLRQQLGQAGAARVRQQFSIEQYVQGVEQVFDSVLGQTT